VVCAVVIAARFVWMYPAIYLPRWLSASLRRRDPSPPWQWPFALAFTGVRGIVSLAAALGIPLATEAGAPFPGRDLILFLTFSVILVTLVGQGLLLPSVIRALGLADAGRRERSAVRDEERDARRRAIAAVVERLDRVAGERGLAEEVVRPLRARHHGRLRHAEHQVAGGDGQEDLDRLHEELEELLIDAEREEINKAYREGKVKDEARRRIERELDLREASLANQRGEA
jgi:CPA1 family monovalent cation:H+ antiporter